MKVTVRKWGNSQGITLPKKVLSSIGINHIDEELSLEIVNNQEIVLKKAKRPITIEDLAKNFDYKSYWSKWEEEHPNQSKELNFGKAVGREI